MKSRIGIVGGGQLGRMLAFEAKRLGFSVTVIDPTKGSPAAQVVDDHILASYSDEVATRSLASQVDVVTIEIEHINTQTLADLVKKGMAIHPSPQSVEVIKNKFAQKQFLKKHKIPTADFKEVSSEKDISNAIKTYGIHVLLKAKFDAFDGRGNVLIKSKKDIAKALEKLSGRELYLERYVPFMKELAVLVARDIQGKMVTYPVVETIHQNNICHMVLAPAPIEKTLSKKAERLALKVMKQLGGAGIFAVEMFLTAEGRILVNEIAPRVHNSGHFTIEACITSQFEQHIRAITGLPLGKTDMMVPVAVMVNVLGDRLGPVQVEGLAKVLKLPNVYVHIYGKAETKPERKMGHITVLGEDLAKVKRIALKARRLLSI